MGAKLSAPKSLTRDQAPSTSILSSYDDHDSFIELLKLDCMKPKKKRRRNEKKIAKIVLKRRLTLEDWIMASPSTEPESFYGGELYVFKQHKKVYPQPYSSSSSLSFDRLRDKVMVNSSSKRNENKKDDDNYGEEEFYAISVVSSLSTISKSEKSKKKVSFRSPDESDIIFFYSPKDRFKGDEELVRC